MVAEVLGGEVGHPAAERGQVVARHPAVEQSVRVVHLTVAQQVHHGALRVIGPAAPTSGDDVMRRLSQTRLGAQARVPAPAPAAARAAAGRAATTRSTAASSCAPETNHDSNALGGR